MQVTTHIELDRGDHMVDLEVTGSFGRYNYGDGSPSGYELDDYQITPEFQLLLSEREKERIVDALYREMQEG